MSVTITSKISNETWFNLTLASGASNFEVTNSGNAILVFVQSITQPDDDSNDGFRLNEDVFADISAPTNFFIWVKALNIGGIVSYTPNSGAISSVSAFARRNQNPQVQTNPASAISKGDTQFVVDDSTGFSQGQKIQISEGVKFENYVYEITQTIAGNLIIVDAPIAFNFTTNSVVESVSIDLASVAGTLSSPIIYSIATPNQNDWLIKSFILSMLHSSAGDSSRFGDISGGLTNGLLIRGVNSNGDIENFTNWKTNADITSDSDFFTFTDKAGSGSFGSKAVSQVELGTINVAKTGGFIRLGGDADFTLQVLVQDDLTSLIELDFKIQGVQRLG